MYFYIMLFNVVYCSWPNRTLQNDCIGDFFQECYFSGHNDQNFYFRCQLHTLLIPLSSLLSSNVTNFTIGYIEEPQEWLEDDLFFHLESNQLDIYKIKQSKTLQLLYTQMDTDIFKVTRITQNLRAVCILNRHNMEIEVILVLIKTKEEQYTTFSFKFLGFDRGSPRLEQYYSGKKHLIILISLDIESVLIQFSLIHFQFRILRRIKREYCHFSSCVYNLIYLPQIKRFFLKFNLHYYLLTKKNDAFERIEIDIYKQILNLNGQPTQYILQKKYPDQFQLFEITNVENQMVFKKHIFNNSDTIIIDQILKGALLIDKNTILIFGDQFLRIILHLETQTLHIQKMEKQCKLYREFGKYYNEEVKKGQVYTWRENQYGVKNIRIEGNFNLSVIQQRLGYHHLNGNFWLSFSSLLDYDLTYDIDFSYEIEFMSDTNVKNLIFIIEYEYETDISYKLKQFYQNLPIKKVAYFLFECIMYCYLLLIGPLFVLWILYIIAEDIYEAYQDRKQMQDFKNKKIIKNNKFYPELLLFEEEECAICFLFFVTDQEVFQLLCGHTFHSQCFELWIYTKKYNIQCPICNQRIDDVKIKPKIKIKID